MAILWPGGEAGGNGLIPGAWTEGGGMRAQQRGVQLGLRKHGAPVGMKEQLGFWLRDGGGGMNLRGYDYGPRWGNARIKHWAPEKIKIDTSSSYRNKNNSDITPEKIKINTLYISFK
jgi:hypothetical protein